MRVGLYREDKTPNVEATIVFIRMKIKNLEKFLDYISDKVESCYKKEVEMAIKDFLREISKKECNKNYNK